MVCHFYTIYAYGTYLYHRIVHFDTYMIRYKTFMDQIRNNVFEAVSNRRKETNKAPWICPLSRDTSCSGKSQKSIVPE